MRLIALTCVILVAVPAAAQDTAELAVAKNVLTQLQVQSFEQGREFCGYIGYNAKGVLIATPAVKGDKASCSAAFPRDVAITASYHTHGNYDAGYFNEVPSTVDMESDQEFYMNGYVSTPGGRLWFVDSRKMITYQICGLGCLPVAPAFQTGDSGEIAEVYDYDALRQKLGD